MNPNEPNLFPVRKSARLQGYDYSQPGGYFITICTDKMIRLFGHIENGGMIPNQFGVIIENEWYLAANLREQVDLHEDEFVLMPNHIHGIIWILESSDSPQYPLNRSSGIKSNSLGAIVAQFKTQTTKKINHLRNSIGTSVWQRNYYDHIIRNDKDLLEIKKYILENPFKWDD